MHEMQEMMRDRNIHKYTDTHARTHTHTHTSHTHTHGGGGFEIGTEATRACSFPLLLRREQSATELKFQFIRVEEEDGFQAIIVGGVSLVDPE
jgi:hypothetical protein